PRSVLSPRGKRVRAGARQARADLSGADSRHARSPARRGTLRRCSPRGRLCTAIKSRLARRVEETKVWRDSGHRSAAHWVAEATGATVGAAARTLDTARALEAVPETDAAFRSG